jgi:phosphoribosyl 1,2-cyclic phosphate phosphodiesterase
MLGGRNIRTRSQAAVYTGDEAMESLDIDGTLLIDLPPDTYYHCLQYGLRMDRVAHLLVTHSHDDHFLPQELPFRSRVYASPMPPFTMNIYGNENVHKRYLDAVAVKEQRYGTNNIIFHVAEEYVPFTAGDFTVTPLLAKHDRTERCLNYMIEHKGKRLLYGNDTGYFREETWDFITGKPFDLVSLDCTFGRKANEGGTHMGLADNVKVKQRLSELNCLKPDCKIVLNHFSHNGCANYDEMSELAKPYGMEVSYDGGVWEV